MREGKRERGTRKERKGEREGGRELERERREDEIKRERKRSNQMRLFKISLFSVLTRQTMPLPFDVKCSS